METKPFSLQSPEAVAKEYGGNKQSIAKAAQMGIVDPTAAVLAGMFIDRMRNAQNLEQAPNQTVAQNVLTPPQQGVAALPTPDTMFAEEGYAGGGIVAFAQGDLVPPQSAYDAGRGFDAFVLDAKSKGATKEDLLKLAKTQSQIASVNDAFRSTQAKTPYSGLSSSEILESTKPSAKDEGNRRGYFELTDPSTGEFYNPIVRGGEALAETPLNPLNWRRQLADSYNAYKGLASDVASGIAGHFDKLSADKQARALRDAVRRMRQEGKSDTEIAQFEAAYAKALAGDQPMDPSTLSGVPYLSPTQAQLIDTSEFARAENPVIPAQQGLQPQPQVPAVATSSGLGAASAGLPNSGIIDYEGSFGRAGDIISGIMPEAPASISAVDAFTSMDKFDELAGVNPNIYKSVAEELKADRENLKLDRKESANLRLIEAGLGIMGGDSPFALTNIGKGATPALQGLASDLKELKKSDKDLRTAERNLAMAENQYKKTRSQAAKAEVDKRDAEIEQRKLARFQAEADLATTMSSNDVKLYVADQELKGNMALAGAKSDIDFRAKATQDVEDRLLKNLTDPEVDKYRQLMASKDPAKMLEAERLKQRMIDTQFYMYKNAGTVGSYPVSVTRESLSDKERKALDSNSPK